MHRFPFRDRADYSREQAVRALEAAGLAREPVARASLFRIAEAWTNLAQLCRSAEELPSILCIQPMVEDSENEDSANAEDEERTKSRQ